MAKQNLIVELFYSGVWNTVPAYTRDEVTITRERPAGSEPTPVSVAVTLQGIHNPKSPFSPLYGVAGQNTPIRIQVDGDVRFYGEVASWEPERTVDYDAAAGIGDAWTVLTANGILRRLGQGADALRSPLFRSMVGITPGDYVPYAYWSLEDGDGATQFSAGLGGKPMSFSGSIALADDDTLPGSAPLPVFSAGSQAFARITPYTNTDRWTVQLVMKVDTEPAATARYLEVETPGGSEAKWILDLIPGSNAELRWYGVDAAGTATGTSVSVDMDGTGDLPTEAEFFGHWWLITVQARLNGGIVFADIAMTNLERTVEVDFSTGLTSTVHAPATSVRLLGGEGLSAGHLTLFTDATFSITTDAYFNGDAMSGWAGELAADRLQRLCREEGVPLSIPGAETPAMGVQPIETLTALFAEIERTDGGLLVEPLDAYGLRYLSGRDWFNRTVALALDYAAGDVAPPLLPVLDDLASRNDVTAKRRNGGEARATLEEGALSVQAPPNGIGRYTTSVDVNPETDAVLPHHAHWHLHKGTVDGVRYASVTVDLTIAPAFIDDAVNVDIGDHITIDNLPADEYSGLAKLIVLGYTETIGAYTRTIRYNCVPYAIYDVGVFGPEIKNSRYGARNTVLAEALTDVETAADVNSNGEVWVTTASHLAAFPFNVDIGGLTYSCTAITGTTPNYTLTLVRLADDKTHAIGDAVTVTDTGRYAL